MQHIGDDPSTGWFAIDARSPSDADGCESGLVWAPERALFVDSCAPDDTFAADGGGLLQYDIVVDADGTLVVDLNQDEDQR